MKQCGSIEEGRTCYHREWECDREKDCADGSDEMCSEYSNLDDLLPKETKR